MFKRITGLMNKKPRCVVVAYNEETQEIETCTVDRAAIQALQDQALVMPWSLEDNGFQLDDEFARKLGGAALLLLATMQPDLAPYITITKAQSDTKWVKCDGYERTVRFARPA